MSSQMGLHRPNSLFNFYFCSLKFFLSFPPFFKLDLGITPILRYHNDAGFSLFSSLLSHCTKIFFLQIQLIVSVSRLRNKIELQPLEQNLWDDTFFFI